jgi:hypothetical protein
VRAPKPSASTQVAPNKTVIKILLREEVTMGRPAAAVTKHPPFHYGRRLRQSAAARSLAAYEAISRSTLSSF